MGISVWQILILVAVVVLIFGTKKLKNVGGDLGSAIKSFKSAVQTGEENNSQQSSVTSDKNAVIATVKANKKV